MDVSQRLDEIVATVDGARSMPMSASCVVNRAELLAMLEGVREALPGSLAQAEEVLGGREQVVAEAQQEAQRILESAQAERSSLIAGTEIVQQAERESERILAEARREAEEIRVEADDYVDSKLANFEVVLSKTIGSVERGREKLLGTGPGEDGYGGYDAEPDAPERTADPEELRHRADEYVDARLGSVAAVLTKTLEAVGRGRQKLLGHRPVDELGSHMAAQQDADGHLSQASDADYLAGLAGGDEAPAESPATQSPAAPRPVAAPYEAGPAAPQAPQPAVAHQDAYGHEAVAYYDAGQPVYGGQEAYYGGQPYPEQAAALDETSLFDTSMIDLNQVAAYEQQYGQQGQQAYDQQAYQQGYGGQPYEQQYDQYGRQAYAQPPYPQEYEQGAGHDFRQGYGQGRDPHYGEG